MSLQAARFRLDEEVALSGQPMRVAGLLQFAEPGPKVTTRFLLAPQSGSKVILEDDGKRLVVLRPFPSTGMPQATGDTVNVMGTPYRLAGIRKLKVVGSVGDVPGGAPAGPLVLSGNFEGEMGALMREMIPGKEGQSFYSIKTLQPADVLNSSQLAERASQARQAARQAAAAKAQAAETADDDDDEEDAGSAIGGILRQAASWIVTILVLVGLGHACADSDEDSGEGSARTSIRLHSGGSDGK